MGDLVYKDLSYKIVGLCFKVHNKLDRYCREKQYADCLENELKNANISYLREIDTQNISDESIKGNRLDFLIENKVVLEIKAKDLITKQDYYQVRRYLESSGLKLGIIVNFSRRLLYPKRILNSNVDNPQDGALLEHSQIRKLAAFA